MGESALTFLGDRILFLSLFIASCSVLYESEALTGLCGVYASSLPMVNWMCHLGTIGVSIACVYHSIKGVVDIRHESGVSSSSGAMGKATMLYLIAQVMGCLGAVSSGMPVLFFSELDRLLIYVGLSRSFFSLDCLWLLAGRVLLMCSYELVSAMLLTDSGSAAKYLLAQPAPFALTWHFVNLPNIVEGVLSQMTWTGGIVGLLLISAGDFHSSLKVAGGCMVTFTALVFSLTGNWGVAPLVLGSVIAMVCTPSHFVEYFVESSTAMKNWGYRTHSKKETRAKGELESLVEKDIIVAALAVLLWVAISSLLYYGWSENARVAISSIVRVYLQAVVAGVLFLKGCHVIVRSASSGLLTRKRALVMIIGGVFGPLMGELVLGSPDGSLFSYTPMETSSDRASVLFHGEIVTQAGKRQFDLSTTGMIHGDEQRPAFLMFHSPRLTLALLSRTAVQEPIATAVTSRISTGVSRAIFGHEAPEGNIGQAFSYAQNYRVTHRMADHHWYSRFGRGFLLIDPKADPVPVYKVEQCTQIIPTVFIPGSPWCYENLVLGIVTLQLVYIFLVKKRRKSD